MARSEAFELLRAIAGATAETRALVRQLRPAAGAGTGTGSSAPLAPPPDTALWREHAAVLAETDDAYRRLGRRAAELPPEFERLADLGQRLGGTLSGALRRVALEGDGLKDVLHGLERQLLGLLTQRLVTAPLDGLFDNLFGRLLGGGLLSGLAGLPGFAQGGSFRVGGSGGPDSRLVPLRLSPGELVEVTPPGRPAPARPAEPIVLNIDVRVSPELGAGDGFGRTGRQIARDLARQLAPVLQGR